MKRFERGIWSKILGAHARTTPETECEAAHERPEKASPRAVRHLAARAMLGLTALSVGLAHAGTAIQQIGPNSEFGAPRDAIADEWSIAIGGGSGSLAENISVSVGDDAVAVGENSVALGRLTESRGYRSVVVGSFSKAGGDSSIAIGDEAFVPQSEGSKNNIAIGTGATTGSTVPGNGSPNAGSQIAIGRGANTEVYGSIAIGDNASTTTNHNAIAIGTDSLATGNSGIALGRMSRATADWAVAVGDFAQATHERSVALGMQSVTADPVATSSVVLLGTEYKFAGNAPTSTVSIGSATEERTITHVAAGRISETSTDAINGSQLYATNQSIEALDAKLAAGGGGGGGGGTVNVTNRYFSVNSTGGSNEGGSGATGPDAIAAGKDASASVAGGVALGAGSVASTPGGIPGYVPPGASDAQRNAIAATTGTQGAVSVGDPANGQYRQITGVAAGTQDSDAVNVSQLKGVESAVAAIDKSSLKYDTNPDGSTDKSSITLGGSGATTPVALHNVAPGVLGTDAVNVNQLNGLKGELNGRIDGLEKSAYGGIASAMALQMPASFVPGKTTMRLGVGTFKGQHAVGVSFRRTAENNGWSLTGGVATSRAGVGATVGAEWVF